MDPRGRTVIRKRKIRKKHLPKSGKIRYTIEKCSRTELLH